MRIAPIGWHRRPHLALAGEALNHLLFRSKRLVRFAEAPVHKLRHLVSALVLHQQARGTLRR